MHTQQRTTFDSIEFGHQSFDPDPFDQLLHAWLDHQQLRDTGAPLAELYDSRQRLDGARLTAATSH